MTFGIITHAIHKDRDDKLYAYAPYVREMNLWANYVDELVVLAPDSTAKVLNIEMAYKHPNIKREVIPNFNMTSVKNVFKSFFVIPKILFLIFKVMKASDHIHLRCPGNIGLLGCLVQILFPNKPKTAKYAGNWDPKAKQPLSYKFQKWLLSNTILTKNMQVLVYGDWEHQTKNIKSFFTATYKNSEIELPVERDYSTVLKFVFVGTLSPGKRPLLAIQIIEALHKQGDKVTLELYGEGVLIEELKVYVKENNLDSFVFFKGNQPKEVIKTALKTAHFSILPSKSEGWPKAVAEAMFFGVIPIATRVSCVPYMLDFGKRGILIDANLNAAVAEVRRGLKDKASLQSMSEQGQAWSQTYTLDRFESEISKLLE